MFSPSASLLPTCRAPRSTRRSPLRPAAAAGSSGEEQDTLGEPGMGMGSMGSMGSLSASFERRTPGRAVASAPEDKPAAVPAGEVALESEVRLARAAACVAAAQGGRCSLTAPLGRCISPLRRAPRPRAAGGGSAATPTLGQASMMLRPALT